MDEKHFRDADTWLVDTHRSDIEVDTANNVSLIPSHWENLAVNIPSPNSEGVLVALSNVGYLLPDNVPEIIKDEAAENDLAAATEAMMKVLKAVDVQKPSLPCLQDPRN